MNISLYTRIITGTLAYSGYRPGKLDGYGRIVGIQIFFPVSIHPVILPGSIGDTDNRCEIVIVFIDQLFHSFAGICYIAAFFHRDTAVVGDTGPELKTVEQFYVISYFSIVMFEVVR